MTGRPKYLRVTMALIVALSLLTGACMSSNQGDSGGASPTPRPTRAPVFIPTTAPPPATAVADAPSDPDDADASLIDDEAANGDEAEAPDENEAEDLSDEPTPVPPIPTAVPSPTAVVAPAPTRVPAPPAPPRPAPRPTLPVVSACPGGQIVTGNGCACPAGQSGRRGDGQCVRICNQSDLTIANTCACVSPLYDNGGQCVRPCLPNEIEDGFGGCRLRTVEDG